MRERVIKWIEDENGCWVWQGSKNHNGYGVKSNGSPNKKLLAHRWLYEQRKGPIPEGLTLDHLCCNPPCVNPEHLEPVTHQENMRRGRGTRMTPETLAQIAALRKEGLGSWTIAKRTGFSRSQIHYILAGKQWADEFAAAMEAA